MALVPFSEAHLFYRLALFGCLLAAPVQAFSTETQHSQTTQKSVVEILNAPVDWGFEWIIVDNGNTEDGDGDKRDENNSGGKRASDDLGGDSRYIIVDNGNTEDGDGDKRDENNSGGKRSLQRMVLTDGLNPRYQLQPHQAEAWLTSFHADAAFTLEKPQGHFQVVRILSDGSGLVWVFGSFEKDLQWRNHRIDAVGQSDLFVANINELGEISWLRRVGGVGNDFLASALLTEEGGLIIGVRSQQFESLVDDPGLTLTGSEAFTLALDAGGKMNWVERNY